MQPCGHESSDNILQFPALFCLARRGDNPSCDGIPGEVPARRRLGHQCQLLIHFEKRGGLIHPQRAAIVSLSEDIVAKRFHFRSCLAGQSWQRLMPTRSVKEAGMLRAADGHGLFNFEQTDHPGFSKLPPSEDSAGRGAGTLLRFSDHRCEDSTTMLWSFINNSLRGINSLSRMSK